MASKSLSQAQGGGKGEGGNHRSPVAGLSGLCAAPEFIGTGSGVGGGRELVEEELGAGNQAGNHGGGSVSTWLSTFLSSQQQREGQSGSNERSKVIGVPATNLEQSSLRSPDSQMQASPGYLGSALGNMPSAGLCTSSTGLMHQGESSQARAMGNPQAEDVDFTPGQYSVASDQMGGRQQMMAQSNGLHNVASPLNNQLYYAGAVMDRPNPDHLMHSGQLPLDMDPAGGQVVTDEHTGQVHVVVHDLHQLKTSSFLPLKLDNKAHFVGHQRSPVDMRSLPIVGVGGDLIGSDPNVALTSVVNSYPSMQCQTPKTRWKPNQAQLTLLERHFNAGYTKATPELFSAVKCAGDAKEAQVSVWLKNRLARSKRQGNKLVDNQILDSAPNSVRLSDGTVNMGSTIGIKRQREELDDSSFDDFHKLSAAVMCEVSAAMAGVQPNDVVSLAVQLCSAGKICCYGVGREKFVMHSFVMRLCHLGLNAYMVGGVDTPVISSGDVMLGSAGPSFYNTVNAVCLAAIRAGARVIAFTAHQTAPLPFADYIIRIPTFPMPTNVSKNIAALPSSHMGSSQKIMQLGSAFEAALWMVLECTALMIQKKLGVSEDEMLAKHTNLE